MSGPTACAHSRDCPSGRRCIGMLCQPDRGDCATDNDCENDTYCACPPQLPSESCACVPWGGAPRPDPYDPGCAGSPFEPGEFKNPVLKCQWPPAGSMLTYKETIISPLVVDLDGDGKPEIVALAPGVAVFDYQGNLKASISTPGTGACTQDYPPAIANLDGAGPPEIITGAQVSRYTGGATPKIDVLWNQTAAGGTWGIIALAEDLDGDGKLEVITGNRVFDGITGADKTKTTLRSVPSGYPAIGDFNGDGHPDIVLVSSQSNNQKVSIIDYWNDRFLMPLTGAANGWGGAPTVADFDGDGRPEFATASANFYYVYSPDCLASPRPAKCTGSDPGVLWQSRTQDSSSGSTGSSVFDFNGDKVAEVVYRDECWLRVYSGPDGKKLFAAPVSSGTDLEMPVIADTDGDGHAEIVVASDSAQNNRCKGSRSATELGIKHPGATFGVHVYQDPQNRWMPSRKIWNQHAYHITHIDDDGRVPLKQVENWRSYNSFRQNVQGMGMGKPPLPDATGKVGLPPDVGDCTTLFRLSGQLCNRGVAPLLPGLPSTFYLGDPRRPGARGLCTAKLDQTTYAGECRAIACDWLSPSSPPYDLWLRVNDDGKGRRPEPQCKAGNDLAHLPLSACPTQPG